MIHDTIKQRLRASLLLAPPLKIVHAQALRYAAALQPDGRWNDVPTGDVAHLERTLVLAKGLRAAAGALDDPLRRAFDCWLAQDFATGDRRHDQILIPRLVGEIALLCEHGLSSGAAGKVMEILARSRWANWVPSAGWVECSGTALLGVAYNQMLRGSLENAASLFDAAFGRIFREIRAVNPGEDGLQTDMTFRVTAGETNGGGFVFMRECAQLIALAHGTPWQAPAETIKLFVAFVLDGQQWMIRHETVDADTPDDVFRAAAGFENIAAIVQQLAQVGNPPRRHELAAFAQRLQGRGEALSGHRYFWRTRLAVHQRPEFYASLRLDEPPFGPSGVADGRMYVLRTGDEYGGLAAATSLAPAGTTTGGISADADSAERTRFENVSVPRLSGGVSEGDCGMAITELHRPGLTGKKAWFFFDDSLLCLGTDLRCAASGSPVATTVNHCRLRGDVWTVSPDGDRRLLAVQGEHALASTRAVEHDGLCYVFPEPASVLLQSGVGTGTNAVADFRLQIDHGPQPRGAAYRYLVLPTEDEPGTTVRIAREVGLIEVLANSSGIQAARHREQGVLGVVFWEPGVMLLPGTGGRVAANHPCLLLCRDMPDGGTRLSIANPGTQAATVHVEYGGRCVCFELPGGPEAGRSMSRLV